MLGKMKVAAVLLAAGVVAGCARSHETQDERIQRQSAEAARQVRQDAQNAGVEARKAAVQAGREARDIVAGVREGWRQGAPASSGKGDPSARVDLNTASAAELSGLPGISVATARHIVRRRPYRAASDLVRRGVLTEAEYDRITDRVVVRSHGSTSE